MRRALRSFLLGHGNRTGPLHLLFIPGANLAPADPSGASLQPGKDEDPQQREGDQHRHWNEPIPNHDLPHLLRLSFNLPPIIPDSPNLPKGEREPVVPYQCHQCNPWLVFYSP
jgi:hypothetical protein